MLKFVKVAFVSKNRRNFAPTSNLCNMSTEQNTENGRSVNAVELDFAKYMRAYTENAHLDVKQYTWQTLEFFIPTICSASLDIADHGFIVDVMRMYSAYVQHNTDDEKTQQRVKRHAEKLLQACEECNAVYYQVNAFLQWFDLMCNNDYENSNEQQ